MKQHPRPWRVEFKQVFPHWDPQSSPTVVDSDGREVCELKQNVSHPGLADPERLELANFIVEKANRASIKRRSGLCTG